MTASLCASLMSGCGPGDSGAGAARSGGALVVATPADTPPYTYADPETGEIKGLEIEIIREGAKSLGRDIAIRRAGFDSLFALVKSGEADIAASSLAILPVRREDVDFTVPYATEGGMFLYRTGEKVPSTISAATIRTGTVDSMTHDFYLCAHGVDPVRFPTYTDAVRALEAGRIDAVYFDGNAVRRSAEESGGRLAASRFETRERLGIALRKGMPELKAALDAAIERRKNGGGL